jgi:hypothetical protein
MILVRQVFQAKFGHAQQVVAMFKQNADMMQRITGGVGHGRILTDLSGSFDTVVQEIEVESLAEWERMRSRIFSDPEFQQMQGAGEPPFVAGRAEFYTIEATL